MNPCCTCPQNQRQLFQRAWRSLSWWLASSWKRGPVLPSWAGNEIARRHWTDCVEKERSRRCLFPSQERGADLIAQKKKRLSVEKAICFPFYFDKTQVQGLFEKIFYVFSFTSLKSILFTNLCLVCLRHTRLKSLFTHGFLRWVMPVK